MTLNWEVQGSIPSYSSSRNPKKYSALLILTIHFGFQAENIVGRFQEKVKEYGNPLVNSSEVLVTLAILNKTYKYSIISLKPVTFI